MIIFLTRQFLLKWGPDVGPEALFASAEPNKILARLAQAQMAIRTPANFVVIPIILTVVLPETNGTDLMARGFFDSQIATTRAWKGHWTGLDCQEFEGATAA